MASCFGSYFYSNRYSFFKYLPAVEENKQLRNINEKLCNDSGMPFSGRTQMTGGDYLDIYSYKNGELDGLNVIYYKNNIKEVRHWKNGEQHGLFQMYTDDGILIDNAN